jgi:hypothetical protein
MAQAKIWLIERATSSLRAKRSNPASGSNKDRIASSQLLIAMTARI